MCKRMSAVIILTLISLSSLAMAESLEMFVENRSNSLLAEIDKGRENFAITPEILYTKVGDSLNELVDFNTITRGVMGSYYKGATAEQRTAFKQTFSTSIIETYTKALVVFKSKSIEVIPLAQQPDSKAILSMKVTTQDGAVFMLTYNMVKNESRWRVRNIIVDGINLGLTYRNQFKAMMTEHHDDINAVISHWRTTEPNDNS